MKEYKKRDGVRILQDGVTVTDTKVKNSYSLGKFIPYRLDEPYDLVNSGLFAFKFSDDKDACGWKDQRDAITGELYFETECGTLCYAGRNKISHKDGAGTSYFKTFAKVAGLWPIDDCIACGRYVCMREDSLAEVSIKTKEHSHSLRKVFNQRRISVSIPVGRHEKSDKAIKTICEWEFEGGNAGYETADFRFITGCLHRMFIEEDRIGYKDHRGDWMCVSSHRHVVNGVIMIDKCLKCEKPVSVAVGENE